MFGLIDVTAMIATITWSYTGEIRPIKVNIINDLNEQK
jgi:hypothetical protein